MELLRHVGFDYNSGRGFFSPQVIRKIVESDDLGEYFEKLSGSFSHCPQYDALLYRITDIEDRLNVWNKLNRILTVELRNSKIMVTITPHIKIHGKNSHQFCFQFEERENYMKYCAKAYEMQLGKLDAEKERQTDVVFEEELMTDLAMKIIDLVNRFFS